MSNQTPAADQEPHAKAIEILETIRQGLGAGCAPGSGLHTEVVLGGAIIDTCIDALLSEPPSPQTPAAELPHLEKGQLWWHHKSGAYWVMGVGKVEATGQEVVVYLHHATGQIWTRPRAEFVPPRFVQIKPFA